MADGLRIVVAAAALAACRPRTVPEPSAPAAPALADPAPAPAPASSEPPHEPIAGRAPGAPPAVTGHRSCLLDGPSPCISAAPLRVGSELIAWSDSIADYAEDHGASHALPITECRWVAELDQVLLCGSPDMAAMNPPLTRASIFVENKPREVVAFTDPLYASLLYRIGGHDLMRRHPRGTHPDLTQFYAAVDAACTRERTLCATPAERAMRTLLERAWADKPSFVLLTFAHHGTVADDEAVSHEILHAQYFTDPRYRAAIDDYWRALPEAARAAVRRDLGTFYNPQDDELMANELQAYVLMSGATRSRFSSLVEPHGPALAKQLAARGVAPIAVQRREL